MITCMAKRILLRHNLLKNPPCWELPSSIQLLCLSEEMLASTIKGLDSFMGLLRFGEMDMDEINLKNPFQFPKTRKKRNKTFNKKLKGTAQGI